MSEDGSRTLYIRLRPSPQLLLALVTLHLGAVACALASDLPAAVQWPLVLWVATLAHRRIALHATGQAARSVVLIVWDGQGRWRLVQRDGQVLEAALERGAYVHPALVALPFRTRQGRHRRVLVVPDRVDAEGLRRLRARLRCESPGTSVAGGSRAVC